MLEHLRDSSVKRHEKLKEIWENPEQPSESGQADGQADDVPEDASDWEKRLEGMTDGDDSDSKEAPK